MFIIFANKSYINIYLESYLSLVFLFYFFKFVKRHWENSFIFCIYLDIHLYHKVDFLFQKDDIQNRLYMCISRERVIFHTENWFNFQSTKKKNCNDRYCKIWCSHHSDRNKYLIQTKEATRLWIECNKAYFIKLNK